MRLVDGVGFVITLMEFLLHRTLSHGMTTFQCPNGFFLSRFGSAYDGSERLYKFGCSRFSPTLATSFNETCMTTEVASTENGDMYLDCPGESQYTYTVGVEVIEDVGEAGADTWQLLCCHSDSVQVRVGDCIDTKFINDARRSSSFSSSTQIIRRWQAMQEDGDKRWWLQLCPVDIRLDGSGGGGGGGQSAEGRYRHSRQVPWSWSRRRFPPSVEGYNPIFSKQLHAGAGGEERGGRRLFDHVSHFVGNRLPVAPAAAASIVESSSPTSTTSTTTTTTTTTTASVPETTAVSSWETGSARQSTLVERVNARKPTPPPARARIHKFSEKSRLKAPDPRVAPVTQSHTPSTSTAAPPSHQNERVIEATDYYDTYDTSDDGGADASSKQKRRKNGEPRSLLGDVSELLQGVQDGLILAQAAFPKTSSPVAIDGQNFHLRIAITPPPPTMSYRTNKIVAGGDDSPPAGSFVQQQEDEKVTTIHKSDSRPHSSIQSQGKRKEANTIENMLQMIGLCQRHEDL